MFASQTPLTVTDDDGDLQVSGEITGYDTRASALSSASPPNATAIGNSENSNAALRIMWPPIPLAFHVSSSDALIFV